MWCVHCTDIINQTKACIAGPAISVASLCRWRGEGRAATPGGTLQGVAFYSWTLGILAFVLQCVSISLYLFLIYSVHWGWVLLVGGAAPWTFAPSSSSSSSSSFGACRWCSRSRECAGGKNPRATTGVGGPVMVTERITQKHWLWQWVSVSITELNRS